MLKKHSRLHACFDKIDALSRNIFSVFTAWVTWFFRYTYCSIENVLLGPPLVTRTPPVVSPSPPSDIVTFSLNFFGLFCCQKLTKMQYMSISGLHSTHVKVGVDISPVLSYSQLACVNYSYYPQCDRICTVLFVSILQIAICQTRLLRPFMVIIRAMEWKAERLVERSSEWWKLVVLQIINVTCH